MYPSPRRFASTDTTTYPGHLNAIDEGRVGDVHLGKPNASPLSSTLHIADVDSAVSIAKQVRNTKISPLIPSRSFCSKNI